MDELLEILTDLHPDVDFETCDTLIDDKILDSFDIVSIIAEVNDVFDITIPAEAWHDAVEGLPVLKLGYDG